MVLEFCDLIFMMVSFNNKKINAIKTLGERLQEHRRSCGLSLENIAHGTKINVNYLIALEKDNFDKLPSDVYTKNFLRKYAEFLDLNPETVIDIYDQEKDIYFKTKKNVKKQKKENEYLIKKIFNFFLKPQFLKYAVTVLVISLLVVYIGWGISKIFTPPRLVINEPEDSLITAERQVWIRGNTEKEVLLTINGQEIISDKEGSFSDQLDLQKGLNIIKITARKKHSKENVQYLKIIVEDNTGFSKN